MKNPHIHANLRQELDTAIPNANMEVPYSTLEALPYLVRLLSCYFLGYDLSLTFPSDGDNRESLRISALVPNRSLLTADEPLQYKQWSLKPGVSTAMITIQIRRGSGKLTQTNKTAFCMNTSKYLLDSSIYRNPTMFDPERWLGDAQSTQKLLHHFAPFSKGHRGCIGMK